MKKSSSRTIYAGLLGHPVSGSLFPTVMNRLFELCGLKYAYECFDVDRDEFTSVLDEIKLFGFKGVNIAYPGKNIAAYLCDSLDRSALLPNSVDTILMKDGRSVGFNTRGTAFLMSSGRINVKVRNSSITIFGCGQTALSVVSAAATHGASSIYVGADPSDSHYRQLLKVRSGLLRASKCRINVFDPADINAVEFVLSSSQILVNATACGMAPDVKSCILQDPYLLTPRMTVADIVYYPRDTVLLTQAARFGCSIIEGLDFLVNQAIASFRIWTGLKVPEEVLPSLYQSLYPQTVYTAELPE